MYTRSTKQCTQFRLLTVSVYPRFVSLLDPKVRSKAFSKDTETKHVHHGGQTLETERAEVALPHRSKLASRNPNDAALAHWWNCTS